MASLKFIYLFILNFWSRELQLMTEYCSNKFQENEL